MAHSELKKMAVMRDLSKKQELRGKSRKIENEIMRIRRLAAREIRKLEDMQQDTKQEIRSLTIRKIAKRNGVGHGFVEKVNNLWLRGKM